MADASLLFNIVARDQASSKMDKIKGSMKLLGVAAGVMALKFGKDSVAAFTEAQAAQDKLQFALGKFPKLADTNIERLGALNSKLSQKTKFDDDATASGQAVLAQFGMTGRELEKLTPLMQDYAAKTGKDLPTSATILGKALNGSTMALKKIGIDYKSTGDKATDMANIQQLLNEKVGGFAEREGKTAAGQAAILSNQFGEVQETVGSKLVPVLTKLAGVLLEVIGFVQRNSKVIGPLAAGVAALGVTIWAVNAATKAWTAATAAWTAISKVSVVWTKAQAASQWLLNAAMTANPIGLVVAAIALLIGGLILAYKHSETFRNVVSAAFSAVGTAASFLWDKVLRPYFNFITNAWLTVAGVFVHGAAAAFGWIPGIGPKLEAAAVAFDAFKTKVNKSLDGITDHVDVDVGIKGGQKAINEMAQLRWEIDHIPTSVTVGVLNKAGRVPRAAGGPVYPGVAYVVGEHGPETFVTGQAGQIVPHAGGGGAGGGGNTYVINVTGVVGDKESVMRHIRDGLDDLSRRRGGATLAPAR